MVLCPNTALTALSSPFRSSLTFSELPALTYIQNNDEPHGQKNKMQISHGEKKHRI